MANSTADYGIYISENGGAEQDPEEWWEAICSTTRALFDHSEVKPDEIEGIAFCSQMAGTVLVDEDANAVRRPMNYLDIKGVKEYKECMGNGIIKVSGCSLYKLVEKAANDLGLVEGTPVFGGGGDITFVNIGAGCTRPGDTHMGRLA